MYGTSNQILRQTRLVEELKCGRRITAKSFSRQLYDYEGIDGEPLGCSERTVMRDIRDLKASYGAPIGYDRREETFYLADLSWQFNLPSLARDELFFAWLGSALASAMLPKNQSRLNREALAKVIAGSDQSMESLMIDTLYNASGMKTTVDAVVFDRIFNAWRENQAVKLTYCSPAGEESEKIFEPHILAFNNGNWYVKGRKCGDGGVRTYALQRIRKADYAGRSFERDAQILEATRQNGLFDFPTVTGVRLRIDPAIEFYVKERRKIYGSELSRDAAGFLIMEGVEMPEHDLLHWVLSEGGRIEVLAPPELRAKVAAAGRRLAEVNC